MGDCATQPMRFGTEAAPHTRSGLRRRATLASEDGLRDGFVPSNLRVHARVANEIGPSFASFPRQAARFRDSLQLRG
jgi:hypothetical protein